ncbi:lytic transglycosylase domain-containing protein [Phenylobacterium sp.]|uniref:lytic transglycosylase domain-containing protein n=1 Tax=Phenylobacterium sp. TaxID=1871053 RepID=UPI0035638E07
MSLDPATILALAARCAPAVAAPTLRAVAQAESGLNPYAVGVNRGPPVGRPPRSRAEAIALAKRLLAAGANLDLGLVQINSANLARLGLSVDDAFDPCRNLAAGATVLKTAYAAVRAQEPAPQAALRAALSIYNTGDADRGFRNGYVTRVVAAAARLDGPVVAANAPSPWAPPPAAWDAFGDLRPAAFVTVVRSSAQGAIP